MPETTTERGTPAYVTKDSGQPEDFATGSRRDTQDGKPRYDLLPVAALKRWAELMARGAEKYGERNWEKGQPMARTGASLLRHVFAYLEGEATEDHLAAILFNAGSLIHHEEAIKAGTLPAALDDRPRITVAPAAFSGSTENSRPGWMPWQDDQLLARRRALGCEACEMRAPSAICCKSPSLIREGFLISPEDCQTLEPHYADHRIPPGGGCVGCGITENEAVVFGHTWWPV